MDETMPIENEILITKWAEQLINKKEGNIPLCNFNVMYKWSLNYNFEWKIG